jgi:hypothetical protein
MPEMPFERLLLELELVLEFTRHGLSSSLSRTVMVLVVSTVRIIVGRPIDDPGLLDDGLASSFLAVVVVVVDDLLLVVSTFLAIPFLSAVDETDVTLLDVVDRVETGSAVLRLEIGVVGRLLDDTTGRLIPVVLTDESSTFSD